MTGRDDRHQDTGGDSDGDRDVRADADGQHDAGEERASRRRSHTLCFTGDRGVCPSLSVIEAVAEATGTDPTELRPLHDAVDADALDTLVGADHCICVTFRYEGCDVTVYADGRTTVRPAGDDGR